MQPDLFPSRAKYVIDTSSLIELSETYPRDLFEPLWKQVEALIESGELISCEDVFIELEAQEDRLHQWAKVQRDRGFFRAIDSSVQVKVKAILQSHENLLDWKRRASSADGFVIAQALVEGCSVVTEETPSGGPHKSKMPDVCRAYAVRCLTVLEMLRETGFRLE